MRKRIALKITCSDYYHDTIFNDSEMLVVPKSPKHHFLLDKAFRKLGYPSFTDDLKKELKAFNSKNDFVKELRTSLNIKEARKRTLDVRQLTFAERIDLGTTDYKELLIQALEEKYMTDRNG